MLSRLLVVNPYQVGVYSILEQWKLVLFVFGATFIMPAFALLMMRSLNMVSSFRLEDKQERIGPYIITGIFYLWMFINFKNNQAIPLALSVAILGATIALFISLFVNHFSKISAHAVGMGGLVGMSAVNTLYFNYDTFTLNMGRTGAYEVSTNFLLLVMLVLAGAVCTSRLLLKAHTSKQLYGGFAAGFLSQFISLYFLT